MASESIFPDEIMIEILLKLPTKSILRCKTLSKHYYSLIYSKYFIRRHLTLSPLNEQSIISPIIRGSVRLFDRRRGHIQVLQIPPPFAEDSSAMYHLPRVCDPVNGLYCVLDQMNNRYQPFAIWNPTTREQFILPPVPGVTPSVLGNRECFVYGFGYDYTTDEYKVVFNYPFFPDKSKNAGWSFNIFNISKGEWTSVQPWSGIVPWGLRFGIGVFVHGSCHWIYVSSPGFMILALDMATESHRFIALPTVGDEHAWSEAFIVTFNGCLGLVNAQNGDNMPRLSLSFDVWVMAEYGVAESWTMLLRVALPVGICGQYLGIVRDRFYIREGSECLVSYDLYLKDEERYDILDGDVLCLLPYEESLVRIIKSI